MIIINALELQSLWKEIDSKIPLILDELNKQNLLVDVIGTKSPEFTKIWNVVLRHTKNQSILIKKGLFTRAKISYFTDKAIKEQGSPVAFSDEDWFVDYIHHITSYILAEFELLKRFLRIILDKDQLKFSDTAMYGTIIDKMEKKVSFKKNELEELFEINVRNMLAHDSWLIENSNEISYKDLGGTSHTLSLEELSKKAYKAFYLQQAILKKYYEIFKPGADELKHLTQILKSQDSS